MLGGLSAADFYGLTFGEAAEFINQLAKDRAQATYSAASLTSNFVALSFSGKRLPDISSLYPSLFTRPEEDYEKNEMLFRQFAVQHNAQRANK
jgi:hypothetical protein